MSADTPTEKADLDFIRKQFPFFTSASKDWAFFENAGGTLPCAPVVDRLTHFYRENKVQPYPHNALANAAQEQMDAGRATMAELLGVPESTVTLGPSTTQNFNTLSTACAAFLKQGDEILVSEQDHEANIGGWERLARNTGATLRFWPMNPETGELELPTLETCLTDKTKIVCVTHSSNILGALNPVAEIVKRGHNVGAKVILDGVSYAPHRWPDIAATGADAYAFSTYKTFATHLGVLYVAPDVQEQLTPQCHFFNIGKTYTHLDAAGPDHASIAALAGLKEFFTTLHDHHINAPNASLKEKARAITKLTHEHESTLCALLLDALNELPVQIIGKRTPENREANVAFRPEKISSLNLVEKLGQQNIAVGHGDFYAYRLLQTLGINTKDGLVRISFAQYNTQEETKQLITALQNLLDT